MMRTISDVIIAIQAYRKINDYGMESLTGVPQSTIYRLRVGDSTSPRANVINRLSEGLSITKAQLLGFDPLPWEGESIDLDTESTLKAYETALVKLPTIEENRSIEYQQKSIAEINRVKIPVLHWSDVGRFFMDRALKEDLAIDWISEENHNWFALKLYGDSMSGHDVYKDGEVLIVDADISPSHGDDVIVNADGKISLRRFKIDEHGPYLLQLNGEIMHRPNSMDIYGVVVYSRKNRKVSS